VPADPPGAASADAEAEAEADALAAVSTGASLAGRLSHQTNALANTTAPSRGSQRGEDGSAGTGKCGGRSSPFVGSS
jgi:hypothetical protein